MNYSSNDFAGYFDTTGAAAGSTHYQSTFFEPLILNYMNPATQGALSMADPRWTTYANWELSIQTPPEPRFGNVRKGYSNGDGNTEADVRTGMLGTALYPVNAPLAGNLMWAWQQSNSPAHLTEDGQFVTTLAVIDPTIPAVIPGTGVRRRWRASTSRATIRWSVSTSGRRTKPHCGSSTEASTHTGGHRHCGRRTGIDLRSFRAAGN